MTAAPVPHRMASAPTYLVRAIAARNFVNLKRALQPYELTPVGWRILGALRESDGQNIAHLADRTATDRSNLSRAIEQLEREGLVYRRSASRDRRNVLVSLTPDGSRKLDEILPIVQREIATALAGFSEEEIATLMSLLRRMADNVFRGTRV